MLKECPVCLSEVVIFNNICPSCRSEVTDAMMKDQRNTVLKIDHRSELPRRCLKCCSDEIKILNIKREVEEEGDQFFMKILIAQVTSWWAASKFKNVTKSITIHVPLCKECTLYEEDIRYIDFEEKYMKVVVSKEFKELCSV